MALTAPSVSQGFSIGKTILVSFPLGADDGRLDCASRGRDMAQLPYARCRCRTGRCAAGPGKDSSGMAA